MNNTLITSCGIIRNRFKPRPGVISINSLLLDQDAINNLIDINDTIDLSFEDFIQELEDNNYNDDEIQEHIDFYENDNPVYLIGDVWKKVNNKYIIDNTKEFAGTYHDGIIIIEYSKYTKLTNHTSPCFICANGDGPLGDLDVCGDSVTAYDLPKEFYNIKE